MITTDLLILGGGITGTATACLAARHGLSVALIELADLASGASGATSHMLHGGLRYLEHGRLNLVREALHERRFWIDRAPDFSRPVRFLLPLRTGGRVSPLRLRAGLWLYDRLAGSLNLEKAAGLSARDIGEMEPSLDVSMCRGGGAYSDGVVDDAGLTIALAREARAHGAIIRTWSESTAARRDGSGHFEISVRDTLASSDNKSPEVIRSRVVVNATGSWTDATRDWLLRQFGVHQQAPSRLLAPTRGIHLVYPSLTRGHGILFFARADGRVLFIIPFQGRSLVGTTETAVESPPRDEERHPTVEEIVYLRRELALLMPATADQPPIALFSGIRPLLAADDQIGRASREHRILSEDGVITVTGGKYTTARLMARDVLTAVGRHLGGSARPAANEVPSQLVRWEDTLNPDGLADTAIHDLFARRLDDVMRRRSALWLSDDRGLGRTDALATAMGVRLGWSQAQREFELNHYRQAVVAEQVLIARTGELIS
ncbi:MAG: glycerol-3-phosphate dehydrogenase/oxidase [Candidatus Eisenbacteria bacterium]|nr:glycerol-3-phosphate dehydrogenase/oxidase [Candidatus Eisenbacteria bacterium]